MSPLKDLVMRGVPKTEAARATRAEKIKASWTPERRAVAAEATRQRNLVDPPSKKPGVGAKISAANKGRPRPHTPEWEANRQAALHTPEVRQKQSIATFRRFSMPGSRQAHGELMRAVHLARGMADEEREARRASARKQWTPEKKALMLERLRSPEVRQKISDSQRGKKHSRKRVANMVVGLARARRRGGTSLELALERLLRGAGIPFMREVPFGRAIADAYSPAPFCLVWEADEPHWHDPEKDARRDAALLLRDDIVAVIRLVPEDLKPWLE